MSGFQQPLFAPAQGGKVRAIDITNVLGNTLIVHHVLEIDVWKLTSVDTPLESLIYLLACIGNRIM